MKAKNRKNSDFLSWNHYLEISKERRGTERLGDQILERGTERRSKFLNERIQEREPPFFRNESCSGNKYLTYDPGAKDWHDKY